MRAYGADIHLTPGKLSTDGAIEEAYRLAREQPEKYVLTDQFNNPASIEAHYRGTGQEIWDQTEGKVTHVVITLGTSGTAMGVTKRLKELNPEICIVAVEPKAGHKIQGLKNMQASYPPGIYNKKALDKIVRVEDEEAFETARRLAREEGLFVGMSSGAAMAIGLKVASELERGPGRGPLARRRGALLEHPALRSARPAGRGRAQHRHGQDRIAATQTRGRRGFSTIGPPSDPSDCNGQPDDLGRLAPAWCWLDVLSRHLVPRIARERRGQAGRGPGRPGRPHPGRGPGGRACRAQDYAAGVLERREGALAADAWASGPARCSSPRLGLEVPKALDICRKLLGKGAGLREAEKRCISTCCR